MQAAQTYVASRVTDKSWQKIFKRILTGCYEEIKEDYEGMARMAAEDPFNVSPDECSIRYMVFTMCIDVSVFAECPNNNWTTGSNLNDCNQSRKFIENCDDNDNAMIEFLTGVKVA